MAGMMSCTKWAISALETNVRNPRGSFNMVAAGLDAHSSDRPHQSGIPNGFQTLVATHN
jgi:hypothetical protein